MTTRTLCNPQEVEPCQNVLQIAAEAGSTDCVAALLEHGARVDAVDTVYHRYDDDDDDTPIDSVRGPTAFAKPLSFTQLLRSLRPRPCHPSIGGWRHRN